jgi:hypothetical protein
VLPSQDYVGVPDGTSRRLIEPCSELPYAAAVHGGADDTVGLGTDLLWQSVVTGISIQEIQLGKRRIRS